MRLIIAFVFVAAALAQPYQEQIVISVTDANGNTTTETISGQAAAAGLDTFTQWVADQNKCPSAEPCQPRYPTITRALRAVLAGSVLQLAARYPSRFTTADRAALLAAQKALQDKQQALAAAAAGTEPPPQP